MSRTNEKEIDNTLKNQQIQNQLKEQIFNICNDRLDLKSMFSEKSQSKRVHSV